MSSGTPHAADQAGGEVVYSSDGLDPLPLPLKPPQVPTFVSSNDDAVVSQDSVSTEQPFEVFADKLYPPAGGAVLFRTAETPLQRLGIEAAAPIS